MDRQQDRREFQACAEAERVPLPYPHFISHGVPPPVGVFAGLSAQPVLALLPPVVYILLPPTPGDGLALLGMLSSSAA